MAAPQQTKFTIPLTWSQWRGGRPDTAACPVRGGDAGEPHWHAD